MKFNRELLKGHLRLILLAVLHDGPCHAYALQKKIHEKSLGVFDFTEGTLYPTLHKLEKEQLIQSEWKIREQGPKIRIYSLTQKGIKTLNDDTTAWKYFSRAMNLILISEE